FQLFEGTAHAEAQVIYLSKTIHRLKVAIKGQIQFSTDGGPFVDWRPEGIEGDRVIRALDPNANYVDTKINQNGGIELNYLLRLSGPPALETFGQAMQELYFYRTAPDFPTTNLDEQKTCTPSILTGENACRSYKTWIFASMKDLNPAQPNYGASTDFSNVPECPPAP